MGLTNFDRVDFVYTDVHVAESYEALGGSAIEARRKAVKNIRGVRAKITTTVNELDPAGARLCVRPMSEFQSNEAYRELHADLLTRLKDDEDLRAVCQDLVRRFLSTKVGPRQGGDGYSRAGVHGLHLRRGPAIPRHTCDSRSAVVVELLPPITAPRRNALRPRIGTTGIAQSRPRHCYP